MSPSPVDTAIDVQAYVAAYRKVIPPNLSRWVLFRHGTVYVFSEAHPVRSDADLGNEAIAFVYRNGPVIAGGPSGDFRSIRLRDDLGWIVLYDEDGLFNLFPGLRDPQPGQDLVIGLMGRKRRAMDAAGLEVVHVENPK